MRAGRMKRGWSKVRAWMRVLVQFTRGAHRNQQYEASLVDWVAKSRILHREISMSGAVCGKTQYNAITLIDDQNLIKRIIFAYQRANKTDIGESMWELIFSSHHRAIHDALMESDERLVADIYRSPGNSELFFGFDFLRAACQKEFQRAAVRAVYARLCLDGLVRFAESVGAIPLDNPERWATVDEVPYSVESIMVKLNESSWSFSVPNPFPDEFGLSTSRGVLTYRVPQALYQAWRIKQLVKGIENPRVLEIGAGLGRTAYYVRELGIKDYTIVDIPMTASAQAYFLGRTLGEKHVCLNGESTTDSSDKVKILTPQTFLDGNEKYDLIVNVDSLTEMDASTAGHYWQKIKASTKLFLSINHEVNSFRVRDLITADMQNLDVSRGLYWMRRGYAEEVIRMNAH